MASAGRWPGHVELTDLEQPQRVHHPRDLGARQLVDALDDRLRSEVGGTAIVNQRLYWWFRS
jgi:hypothetical protein